MQMRGDCVMIYTSYFAKMRKMTPGQKLCCVSVARYTPKGIKVPVNTVLAPKADILKAFKEDGDTNKFEIAYREQLKKLDVDKVAQRAQGTILCCFEKSGDFCHRHILAEWFNSHGYKCKELNL